MSKTSSLKIMQERLTPSQKLQRLRNKTWAPDPSSFGMGSGDIDDLEISHYVYFLDNVKSLSDLREGLHQLSPLADDALEVAENMDEGDFYEFKLALAYERRVQEEGGESKMPAKYFFLLLPALFLRAVPIAEKFRAGMGSACIRILDLQEKNK